MLLIVNTKILPSFVLSSSLFCNKSGETKLLTLTMYVPFFFMKTFNKTPNKSNKHQTFGDAYRDMKEIENLSLINLEVSTNTSS